MGSLSIIFFWGGCLNETQIVHNDEIILTKCNEKP